jgi:hypothetical protein
MFLSRLYRAARRSSHRHSRRRGPQTFRPSLEVLESRCTPAVIVNTGVDAGGASFLQILGDRKDQTLLIEDDGGSSGTSTAKVFLDANSNGILTDPGDVNGVTFDNIEVFDIHLAGGSDHFTFHVTGDYHGVHKTVIADLGSGNNDFTFTTNTSDIGHSILGGSRVALDVLGGNQNDFTPVHFDAISDSAVSVYESLGGGADVGPRVHHVTTPSSISFNGTVDNSSLDTWVDLGPGGNLFAFTLGGDVGNSSPADVSVNLLGGPNADQVITNLTGNVNTASIVNVNVQLGDGNDRFTGVFDLAHFDVTNTSGAVAGGTVHLTVNGGAGNDTLLVTRGDASGPATLDGWLDLNLNGGAGNDTIGVDFGFDAGSPMAFGTADEHALLRGLHLRVYGGAGNDTIDVVLSNDATATFDYDVEVFGNDGNDAITFTGVNDGGSPGYSGSIVLDGGSRLDFGHGDVLTVGSANNFPVHERNFDLVF